MLDARFKGYGRGSTKPGSRTTPRTRLPVTSDGGTDACSLRGQGDTHLLQAQVAIARGEGKKEADNLPPPACQRLEVTAPESPFHAQQVRLPMDKGP